MPVQEVSIEDSGSVCTLSRRRPARAAEQSEAAWGGAPGQGADRTAIFYTTTVLRYI